MIIPIILLTLLFFPTIFFGGPHVWVQTLLVTSLFLFVIAGLWHQTFKSFQNSRLQISIIREPLVVIGLLFLVWTALSLIPLPAFVLKVLSPKTYQVWETASLVGGKFPQPLSLYPYMTLNSWVFGLALFFFCGLTLYGIRSYQQIHWLVIGILTLGGLESIYALIQLASAHPYILWWRRTSDIPAATGTFINRNHLANFLTLIVCLGVGYLWTLVKEHSVKNFPVNKSWIYHLLLNLGSLGAQGIVLLLTLGLVIAALLTTASRGGTLALLAGLFFMGGLMASRFFKSRKAVVLLVSISLICSYVGYAALEPVLERFQRFELDFGDRLAIVTDTFRMVKDFPLAGSGLGTFEFVFPAYQNSLTDGLVDYAHNDWVQLFAETGIVGFIILGGGFLWFMWHSIILWRRHSDPLSVGLGLGGVGALVSVAVHSLMDFSLHIPANALLLTLVAAITSLSLRLQSTGEKLPGDTFRLIQKVSLWAAIPSLILFTLLIGGVGLRTYRVWQADSLARTVWNSTIPFKDPSDLDLIKGWTLAPGNAQYWSWLASRVSQQPEMSLQIEQTAKNRGGWTDIHLLGQGILRNPTAWNLWKDLSWAAFIKAHKEPRYYFSLAEQASSRASQLRPFSFSGYYDYGMIGLASYARQGGKAEKTTWMKAFNRALSLNPQLAPKVVDQILLYLGSEGTKEIRGFLPKKAQAYLLTGGHLLKQGIDKEGLECLEQGERYREKEIDRLWEEIFQRKAGPIEKRQKIVDRLFSLDPQYPRALLLQGKVVEALTSQDRRGKVLGELGDRKELASNLHFLEERNQGPVTEIAYLLGRLAEEDGDLQKAGFQFRRSLEINPQFFPAWIHLEGILKQTLSSEGERVELENLQRKISFFEMTEVAGDAWIWEGVSSGLPGWKAPFRIGKKRGGMEISFSGERHGAWKLVLDGRFVDAWAGNRYAGVKKMLIPEGEHELKLICFTDSIKKPLEKLPFQLTLKFN